MAFWIAVVLARFTVFHCVEEGGQRVSGCLGWVAGQAPAPPPEERALWIVSRVFQSVLYAGQLV